MPVVFTVRNSGGGTTGTPTAAVTGDFAILAGGNKCPSGLNAGAMCTIEVIFKPGSVGSKSGTLTVSAPSGGSITANLSGNGATTGLKITPETRDFGTAVVAGTGTTITFSVENNGGVAVSALMVSVNGTDFAIPMGGSKCGATLDVGAKCAVDVQFVPKMAGDRAGTLLAAGMAGATSVSATAGLSGKAQAASRLIVSPAAQSFTAAVGQTGATVTFTVANVGDAQSGVPMVTLGGTNASDYSLVTNGCITPLAGNATCQIGVAFKPVGTEGMKAATLVVTATPGGTAMSTLTGLATIGKLEVSPLALDFMTVAIPDASSPQTLTIKNTGTSVTGALQVVLGGVDASNFALSSNNCQGATLDPNASCTLQVAFNPKTPAGPKSALLSVSGNPGGSVAAMLTGIATSAAQLSVAPPSFDYMTIPVNTTSSNEFTVTNVGGATTGTVTTTLTGGAYFITANSCNAALIPMGTCKITVQFRPTVAGAFPGTLVVASPQGGTQTVTLNGAATAAPVIAVAVVGGFAGCATGTAVCNFTPGGGTTINVGQVVGTTSAPITFNITNMGQTTTGMLSVNLQGPNMGDFAIASNGCTTLAPGVSCLVTVTFAPTGTGVRNASLVASGMGGTGSATLTGFGLAPLDVTSVMAGLPLYPATFDFGSVTIGAANSTQTVFTATARANVGTLTAAVTAENFAGNFIGATVGACNTAGATPAAPVACNVNVTFSPKEPRTTADAATKKTATITVTAASGATATGTVAGTAGGPLTISPTAGSFPNTATGATSDLSFTVSNGAVNTDSIGPLTVTITGADASQFVKVVDNCTGNSIAGAATCPTATDITIRFAPTTPGTKAATLTVSGVVQHPTGTPTGVTETVTVALSGSSAMGTPITAAPTMLAFTAAAGGQSATQTVTITNPSASATTAVTVANTGSFPTEFTVTGNTCITPIAPAGTCTLTVRFDPAVGSVGTHTAIITVNAGVGNNAVINVSGTISSAAGIAPPTHNFGTVIVGDATGAGMNFTFTNSTAAVFTVGTASIIAGSGANAQPTHFVLTQGSPSCAGGSTINPGATCVVNVKFLPLLGPGTQTADLQIAGTIPTGAVTAKSALTGVAALDANLDLQNIADGAFELRDFGQVVIGGADMRTVRFKLLNSGGSTSSPITRVLNFDDPAHRTAPITTTSEFTLASGAGICTEGQTLAAAGTAGDSCFIDVVFQPAQAAQRRVTLLVQANGLRGGTTGKVHLQGTGLAAANLRVDATNGHDLGAAFASATVPHENTTGVDFTLTNQGAVTTGNLIAPAITATGTNAMATDFTFAAPASGTPCVFGAAFALTAGMSCNFKIIFTPRATAAGSIRATIVLGNAGAVISTTLGVWGRVQQEVTFTATDPNGVLDDATPNANDYDFGKVVAGAMSATRVFVLKNVGERDSGPISVNTSGAQFALDATVASPNCNGSSVAPGGTCNVGIKFAPTGGAGARTGTFTVDPNVGPNRVVDMQGTNATQAVITVVADPAAQGTAFGSKPVGGAFARDYLVTNNAVTNVDTGPLAFSLVGGSAQFTIDQSITVGGVTSGPLFCAVGQVLIGNQVCVIRVIWRPASIATVSTVLNVVTNPGGEVNNTVSGTGTIALEIDDDAGATQGTAITTAFANPSNHTFTISRLANSGASGVLSVTLGSADMGFSILTNNCASVTLTNPTTCTVIVRYAPATPGARTTTLNVSGTIAGDTVVATMNGAP